MSFYTRALHPPELRDFEQKWLESPPKLGGWGADRGAICVYKQFLETLGES